MPSLTKVSALLTFFASNIVQQYSLVNAADDDVDDDGEDLSDLEPDPVTTHVVTLTKDTFSDFTKKGKSIVEFYAPWCGHCKQLEPKYEAAALKLFTNKRKTKLGKVDATKESDLSNQFNVQGFPTLFYFDNGVKSEYDGPRETDGIVQWAESRERDPLEICTEEEWEKKTNTFRMLVRAPKGSGKANAVKKALRTLITKGNTKITACNIPIPKSDDANSSITFYRSEAYTDTEIQLPKKTVWSFSKIENFIYQSMFKGVGNYDPEVYKFLPESGLQVKYMVALAGPHDKKLDLDETARKAWIDEMISLTEKPAFKHLRFTIWEGDKQPRKDLGDFQGPTEANLMVAYEVTGEAKYKKYISKPQSHNDLISWCTDLQAGLLQPWYKSAKVPTNDIEDGVKVLVGSTFKKVALSPKLDVFVEFYAPWCGHCKSLAPVWSSLAKKIDELNFSKQVVIAKMDATENECEEEVTGFPKLVLYSATKGNKRVEFQGQDRTVNGFLDFLAENAVNLEGAEIQSEPKSAYVSMIDRDLAKKKKKQSSEL